METLKKASKNMRYHKAEIDSSESPLSKRAPLPYAKWELNPEGLKEADKRAASIRYTPSSSLSRKNYFSSPSHLSKMETQIRVRIKIKRFAFREVPLGGQNFGCPLGLGLLVYNIHSILFTSFLSLHPLVSVLYFSIIHISVCVRKRSLLLYQRTFG